MASRFQSLGSHTVGVFTHRNVGIMKYIGNRTFTDLRILCFRYHLAMNEESRIQESAITEIGRRS